MNVVDIFCGCGGLSYGFVKQGYKIVVAFDNWDKAVNIYNANFKHKAELLDAYKLNKDYVSKFDVDMIIGGPPCQDYSSAGKQDENLGRADLTLRYADIVCEVKPKWFVMENVDRITKSSTLPNAISKYRETGYGLTQVVLDASLCGAPQKRKRYFMIGELGGEDDFLKKALIENQASKSMTIHDYLGDEFNTEYYYRHPRSYARRGIFSIYEPSPTVRGVNRPIPPNYKFHDGDAIKDLSKVRPLTTLERARIQTFPESFYFDGSKTELEQIIGNAVPVEMASYVAGILKEYIKQKEEFEEVDLSEQVQRVIQPVQMELKDII
jgi:DNA (cytosine-5)-methyltransferase 1